MSSRFFISFHWHFATPFRENAIPSQSTPAPYPREIEKNILQSWFEQQTSTKLQSLGFQAKHSRAVRTYMLLKKHCTNEQQFPELI